jgi:hypothetical protein
MDLLDLMKITTPANVRLTFLPDTDLNPDAQVQTEAAVLLRVTDTDTTYPRVTFRSVPLMGEPFEWEAYFYDGRLSYGSSAEELRVNGQAVTL